jgi:hypothetical protein
MPPSSQNILMAHRFFGRSHDLGRQVALDVIPGVVLSPMHISRLAVGAVIAVLLSGTAIAGALEDCAAAYDRKDCESASNLDPTWIDM